MPRKSLFASLLVALAVTLVPVAALAQNPEQGDVEYNANTRLRARTASRGSSSSSGLRIALQGRLDAVNMTQLARPAVPDNLAGTLGANLLTPVVTPGVRLLDTRLFLGLGLGWSHASSEANNGDSDSQGGFSLVPTVSFDVLSNEDAALSLGAMLTLASLGQTENCNNNTCVDENDDAFGLGLSALVGIRGKISEALSLGTEFGWGFLSVNRDGNRDLFVHGLLGMIVLEASIGL